MQLGALVIIDEENPGQLKSSHQAVRQARGGRDLRRGRHQFGLNAHTGRCVVGWRAERCLSGRVYALATAANGTIAAADLLTTSSVAGHAVKATDAARSHGTVIGKAMSKLESGEGLVLVNLQCMWHEHVG